jgi:phenylpropionate dioxygenase-like ring-hydroxylating dioxygenase large terminal subunit
MNPETQMELLDRIMAHRASGRDHDNTDVAPSSMAIPTGDYTDRIRYEAELDLLSRHPQLVGLSGLVPEPGSYASVQVGRVPVIVTRDDDRQVRAMANVCRHRGAQVVEGCGSTRRLRCPYHGWTYHLDGSPAGRRRDRYFDDIDPVGLVELPCRELDGLIWVAGDQGAGITDQPLHGAEIEVAPFDLARYRRIAASRFRRPLNWKLAVDTFCEAYHVGSLHTGSLDPLIHSDFALFDGFGPHGRMIAVRRSIGELDRLPRPQWRLVPHATILWFVQPNTVLIYQQDHAELYRSRPGDGPGEAVLDVELYAPFDDHRSERYWQRNFEVLVSVTDNEDFTTAAGMQTGFEAGVIDWVTIGRNEPALQHFHVGLDSLLSAPERG